MSMNNPSTTIDEALNNYYTEQIRAAEAAPSRPDRTRFIMKVINLSEHDLDADANSLSLSEDILSPLQLSPGEVGAFIQDYRYSRELGSRSKDVFRHYIEFGDRTVGARVIFGLRINTAFGVLTPTVTPIRTCKVISIGSTPVKCAARITRALKAEPYSFTNEVLLG
jgi:hypothetical protein